MQVSFLVVGLGNPGKKYQKTRHNVGFMVCDYISQFFDIPFHFGLGNSQILHWQVDGHKVVVAKPLTFMNRSGDAVRPLLEEFGLRPDQMLVVCDDFSLPLGTIRIRRSGSSGGHNGLQSIINVLGTHNFPRMRIGIAGEDPVVDWVEFVLSKFKKHEQKIIHKLLPIAVEAIQTLIKQDIETAMNRFNRRFDFSEEANDRRMNGIKDL